MKKAKKIFSIITSVTTIFWSIGGVFLMPTFALAVDSGFLSPTAPHAPNEWGEGGLGDASNAFSSDNQYAQDDDENDEQGYSDFGFSVPDASKINGIEVTAEAKSSDSSGCQLQVKLSWDDGDHYSSQKTAALTGSDSILSFGGATETWSSSHTWNSTEFTNSNFILKISFDDSSGSSCNSATVSVDQIQAKVYYAPPAISINTINGQQPPYSFVCPTNPLFSPVVITGGGTASAPPGNINQYHVQIDWEAQTENIQEPGSVENDLGTFTPSSGQGNFSYNFSGSSHIYTAGSNHTIKARLYHSNPPGNDNQADVVASIPVCVVPEPPAYLTIIKHVIGGTLSAADFNLHVKIDNQDVNNSPADGSETGVTYNLAAGTYVISEDNPPEGYTQTSITGNCASDGSITLASDETKTCTITNTHETECSPTTEICDGADNDCDGQIDEELTRSCYNGPQGTQDVGLCQTGTQTCSAGNWESCTGEVVPTAELCDGLDNNCNGNVTDDGTGEAWYNQATTCGVGACYSSGVYLCQSNQQVNTCQPGTPAATETCDQIDNDCNDQVDEGGVCNQAQICGYKFNDLNQNLTKDENEPKIFNWAIYLKKLIDDIWTDFTSTTTNEVGNYCFAQLGVGDYQTIEDLTQPSWYNSTPAAYQLSLLTQTDSATIIFGNYQCIDADQDGYSSTSSVNCGPLDCDDSNPAIHPGATEICTDQIDNNCDNLTDSQDTTSCPAPTTGILVIKKSVVGSEASPALFSYKIGDQEPVNFDPGGISTTTLPIGTYNITEPTVANYSTAYEGCSEININVEVPKTCTITNTYIPPTGTLTVKKVIVGNETNPSTFSFSVNQGEAQNFEADGQNDLTLPVGIYNITEPAVANYNTTYDGCSEVNVNVEVPQTCTITNTYNPPGPQCTDADQDGIKAGDTACAEILDCNDGDATIYPGATEICDQKDNDCDGQIDEGVVCPITPPPPSGGGGGGGGGLGLIIHQEQIASTQTITATITWLTNHPATSRVIYDTVSHTDSTFGSAPNYGYANSTAEDSTLTTFHSIIIAGLNPGNTYYLRPVSHGSAEVWGIQLAATTPTGQTEPGVTGGTPGGEPGGTTGGGTGAGEGGAAPVLEQGAGGEQGAGNQGVNEQGAGSQTGGTVAGEQEQGELNQPAETGSFLAGALLPAVKKFFGSWWFWLLLLIILIILFLIFRRRRDENENN